MENVLFFLLYYQDILYQLQRSNQYNYHQEYLIYPLN